MKSYTLEIIIEEGNDEFWEEATEKGKTGCDEVVEQMRSMLCDYGFYDAQVKLIKFID